MESLLFAAEVYHAEIGFSIFAFQGQLISVLMAKNQNEALLNAVFPTWEGNSSL